MLCHVALRRSQAGNNKTDGTVADRHRYVGLRVLHVRTFTDIRGCLITINDKLLRLFDEVTESVVNRAGGSV